jgi:thiol-disulfide isomerase/thioredoxin
MAGPGINMSKVHFFPFNLKYDFGKEIAIITFVYGKSCKMRIISVLAFLFSATLVASCQQKQGYEISLNINGLRDSSVYLAYHFGDKQYIKDTVRLDQAGHAIFSGLERLPEGIYMIVLPGRHYFEILISDDQHFSASCTYPDYFNTLKFSGSDENSYFVSYQRSWAGMQKKASAVAGRLQKSRQNQDSVKLLSAEQRAMEENMKVYLRQVVKENAPNLLSVLVRSMIPVDMPEQIIPDNTRNRDSLQWVLRYNFNRDHFFDNIDLGDERILRTPILYARLKAYFENVLIQYPDSIISGIDRLLPEINDNYKVFQFVSVFLFNHFRESEIMGHDAVLLKIADEIYLSGKADWVSKEFIDDLKRQSELLRNNLIGMKAHNLVMDTYHNIFVALYDIEKDFTILYFWEPDCGHCIESTPKLKTYYDKARNEGVEIFAVCTTSDKEKWSKYISENGLNWINGWDPGRATNFDFYYNVQSTPMVYILDRSKTIIAKKISVDDIPSFIDNYRKFFMKDSSGANAAN